MTTPIDLGERYAGYLYAYPHKSAYRTLAEPITLGDAWRGEDRRSLFLYVHVPFCEMRCGYCNLFTQSRPGTGVVDAWFAALSRQAGVTKDELGDARFVRLAVGGGTPTMLSPAQLSALLALVVDLGAAPAAMPVSFEVSPRTADRERLQILRDHGVDRISIGVESFDTADLRQLGRPQRDHVVQCALGTIRDLGFPSLNIDLIYGAPGQTVASWRRTLAATLAWRPEEVYVYPLYVRPLTGIDAKRPSDARPALYELACTQLAAAGYDQLSMRCFRRRRAPSDAPCDVETAPYDCQDDGMVGLGCGARSYTSSLHYSHEYAVTQAAIANIVDAYIGADDLEHRTIRHGIVLDEDEQRRRYAIKSLLRLPGLDRAAYQARFGSDALDDLPPLRRWIDDGHFECAPSGRIVPTASGLAWSDAIGPALISPRVEERMLELAPR